MKRMRTRILDIMGGGVSWIREYAQRGGGELAMNEMKNGAGSSKWTLLCIEPISVPKEQGQMTLRL